MNAIKMKPREGEDDVFRLGFVFLCSLSFFFFAIEIDTRAGEAFRHVYLRVATLTLGPNVGSGVLSE